MMSKSNNKDLFHMGMFIYSGDSQYLFAILQSTLFSIIRLIHKYYYSCIYLSPINTIRHVYHCYNNIRIIGC